MATVSDERNPLSVTRIREVLAALPPLRAAAARQDTPLDFPAVPEDEALIRDYHRIVEIHQLAAEGGLRVALERVTEQILGEAPPSEEQALPAGAGLAARRLDTVREEMRMSAEDTLRRLTAISPDEEAAVLHCHDEIEAALAQLR